MAMDPSSQLFGRFLHMCLLEQGKSSLLPHVTMLRSPLPQKNRKVRSSISLYHPSTPFSFALLVFDSTFVSDLLSTPLSTKSGLASALNLFLTLGVANFVCVGLYNGCRKWFPVDDSGNNKTEHYVNAEINNYLWVLVGLSLAGIVINLIPPVKDWVERLKSESLQASLVGHDHTSKYVNNNACKSDIEDVENLEEDSKQDEAIQGQISTDRESDATDE